MRWGIRVDAAQQRRAKGLCDLKRAQHHAAPEAPPALVERQRGDNAQEADGDSGSGGEPIGVVGDALVGIIVRHVMFPRFFLKPARFQ